MVIVTDGFHTFTIFNYLCGDIESERLAVVGFDAAGIVFENFNFSSNQELACLNSPDSELSTIAYQLNPLPGH